MPDPHARSATPDAGRSDDHLTSVFRRRPPALPGPDAHPEIDVRPNLDARPDRDTRLDLDARLDLDTRPDLDAHPDRDARVTRDKHPALDARPEPDALPGPDERCAACPLRGGSSGPARAPLRPVLPRPALLAHTDPRGTGTLVLPDAFRSSGPEAPTLEHALAEAMLPFAAQRDAATRIEPGRAARDPNFDELAAPDITVMQQASLSPLTSRRTAPPIRAGSLARWRAWWRSHAADPRLHLILHLTLGALIIGGLYALNQREPQTAAMTVCTGE